MVADFAGACIDFEAALLADFGAVLVVDFEVLFAADFGAAVVDFEAVFVEDFKAACGDGARAVSAEGCGGAARATPRLASLGG